MVGSALQRIHGLVQLGQCRLDSVVEHFLERQQFSSDAIDDAWDLLSSKSRFDVLLFGEVSAQLRGLELDFICLTLILGCGAFYFYVV